MTQPASTATEQRIHADKTDAELIEYGRDVIRNMKANGYHGIVWDELLDRFERLAKSPSAIERSADYDRGFDDGLRRAANMAECANPNDGRDHAECPFCSSAREIREQVKL